VPGIKTLEHDIEFRKVKSKPFQCVTTTIERIGNVRQKAFFTYENGALVMLGATFALVFVDRLALNYIFPFIAEDLHLGNTELGELASVLALAWAISGPASGFFASYVTRKKSLLILSLVLFSLCSLLSGMVRTYGALLLFRLLMGIAEGPAFPLCQSIMAVESSESRRGLNAGLLQITSTNILAALIAPVVLVAIATSFNWRYAFYATCIPGIVLAVIMMRFLREPRTVGSLVADARQQQKQSNWTVREVLRHRNIWLGALIGCCSCTWYLLTVTFAPTYMVETLHLQPSTMSYVMSGLGIAGIVWGFGVNAISDRIGRKPALVIFAFISTFSPLTILFFHQSVVLFAVVLAIVHCGVGITPLYMAVIPAESVPTKYLPACMGLLTGVPELFGGVLMSNVAGRAADLVNPGAPFAIAAVAAFLSGLLSLFVIETAPARIRGKAPVVTPSQVSPEPS
jgi:predicted MFS family arabinose efflux permease